MRQDHRHKHHRTEAVYVFFADPDTMEPTLTFLKCLGLEDSQDATSIFEAIKKAFEKRYLLALLDKFAFLWSDGASVNSGKKSGLKSIFSEETEWVIYSVSVTVLNWRCIKKIALHQLMNCQSYIFTIFIRNLPKNTEN